jgi:PD-(D/E)XK nuclease superfamily protein
MEHPKAVGDRSTLAIMVALERCGYALYVPFGENTRTDLVIDNGLSLARVQCKTARLRKGAIRFAVSSSYAHHRRPACRRDYRGEIDYFAVFCPETGGVYLLPIADVENPTMCALRVTEPRNGQVQRIRAADKYVIGVVRAEASSGPRASSGGPGSCA